MEFMPYDEERVREALSKSPEDRDDDDRLIARWVMRLYQTGGDADYEAEPDAEEDRGEI